MKLIQAGGICVKKKKQRRLSTKQTFFKDNRQFWGSFMIIFTMIVLLQATFAWSSYAEWVKNHMQANPEAIAVQVKEKFEQNSVIFYGSQVQKEIKVRNSATRSAIVRVKLKESFLSFVIDLSNGQGQGNGNLKLRGKKNGDQEITDQHPNLWIEGGIYDSGLSEDGQPQYYIASSLIKEHTYLYSEGERPSALEGVALQFHPSVKPLDQGTVDTPAWYYEDGYFYYSKVLAGGETTEIELLQAVTQMSSELSNQFKHGLYYIDVEAYGVAPTRDGLTSWGSSSAVLTMFANDPNFSNK